MIPLDIYHLLSFLPVVYGGYIDTIVDVFTDYPGQMFTCFLCGATCGMIGCFVVLRRMALIGDALSHSILPGVVLAFILFGSTNPWVMFGGAMAAGILTAFTITFLQKHARMKEDSAVGLAFTVYFAIGIILITTQLPRGVHFDLNCFLFGTPLGIHPEDLRMMVIISASVCLLIFLFYRPLFIATFDPMMAAAVGINVALVHYFLMTLLSATVVASLQAVGVIMVIAMVIAPGITAYQLTDRLPVMLGLAAAFGGFCGGAGYLLSFLLDWPPGPAMTVLAGVLFLLAMLFSPKYGVLFTWYRKRMARRHFLEEDVLKLAIRREEDAIDEEVITNVLGISPSLRRRLIKNLHRQKMIRRKKDRFSLTEKGQRAAEEIVRAHRLWEAYLADKGIPVDRVHDLAESLEHAHELADELSETLGRPEHCPHGSEIPPGTHKDGVGREEVSQAEREEVKSEKDSFKSSRD